MHNTHLIFLDKYFIVLTVNHSQLSASGAITMLFQPRNEKGQGLVEYALILVLVSIVVIAILLILGEGVGSVFTNVVSNL